MNTPLRSLFISAAILVSISAVGAPRTTQLRLMTANISSGNKQSYDPGEGIRIFKGLKPDVVMIQEFNYGDNSKRTIDAFVASTFGKGFHYTREEEASDDIPNGVISRFPIIQSGEWEDPVMPNRDFAWARINLPGKRDLWAISVHLHSKKTDTRATEAATLVEQIRVKAKIPPADYVVLGGDFNIASRTDSIIKTLSAVVSEKAAPVDSDGISQTNMNRNKNYDWVLVDADLQAYQVPVKFKGTKLSYPSGLVFTSSSFPNLSVVAPVLKTDSTAPGMQHLPVVKDFAVPAI